MIGIIGAMDLEIEALEALLTDKKTEKYAGITFSSGVLFGQKTVLAVCGIGKVFAAMCTQAMILKYAPAAIINIGVAGTLTEKLDVGDIALAESLVCHDMDTTALGDVRGLISGLGLVNIPTDKTLTDCLYGSCRAEGAKVLRGVIASGDRFVASKEEKEEIGRAFNAIACEMEGQAIGQVCFSNGVPFAVMRSISDSLTGGAMDYERFKYMAAERTARAVKRLMIRLNG